MYSLLCFMQIQLIEYQSGISFGYRLQANWIQIPVYSSLIQLVLQYCRSLQTLKDQQRSSISITLNKGLLMLIKLLF